MEKMTLKKAKRLVWETWAEVLIGGLCVANFIYPIKWVYIVPFYCFFGGLFIMSHAVVSFLKESKNFPKSRTYSVIPTVFGPSAFFSTILVLLLMYDSHWKITPTFIGFIITCIAFWILGFRESKY